MGRILKPFGKGSKEDQIFHAVERGDMLRLKPLIPDKSELLEIRNKYGWTPLHHAVIFNRKNVVEHLVSVGANIYSKDAEGGEMPLNFAVRFDYDDIADILISRGADYIGRGEHTLPPLHLAAIMGSVRSARLIIALGAEVDRDFRLSLCKPDSKNFNNEDGSEILTDIQIQKGLTPLHLAIHGQHKEMVELLIENGADVNNRDSDYDTPLIKASQTGNAGIIKALIKGGADVNAADMSGKTALHHLIISGDMETIAMLIDGGANVNAADNDGSTPIFGVPMSDGHRKIGEYLISKGAEINIKDGEGTSLLQHTAIMGTGEMLETLKNKGVRIMDVFDAVIMGNVESAAKFIDENPTLLNSGNPAGFTPLHFAAMTGNKPMLDMLLKKGADVYSLTKNGQSPLHRASNAEVAQVLIDAGAKVVSDSPDFSPILFPLKPVDVMELLILKGADVNMKDPSGMNFLITVALNADASVLEYLISKGANPDEKLVMGGTALHWVLFDGKEEIAATLLEAGSSPHIKNYSGETPLHIAANGGLVESVRLLTKHGVNPNETDNEGRTPLHYAALGMGNPDEAKKKEIIEILTAVGADVNITDNLQRTPRDYAVSRGYIGILELL